MDAIDDFTLYSKVGLELPKIAEVSQSKWKDFVRAAPPIPEAGRRKAEPAHLDFALIRTSEVNTHTDETNLRGEKISSESDRNEVADHLH